MAIHDAFSHDFDETVFEAAIITRWTRIRASTNSAAVREMVGVSLCEIRSRWRDLLCPSRELMFTTSYYR